jgi:hypothetical protein
MYIFRGNTNPQLDLRGRSTDAHLGMSTGRARMESEGI